MSTIKHRFESLFVQVWRGEVESDSLNKLVLVSELDARQISVLRAYTRYFKQLGFAFSQSYIEDALIRNATIAQDIMALFQTRFDPQLVGDRDQMRADLRTKLEDILSVPVARRPALPWMAPASLIARACNASASVRVDLPASGWLITAKVLRRPACSDSR